MRRRARGELRESSLRPSIFRASAEFEGATVGVAEGEAEGAGDGGADVDHADFAEVFAPVDARAGGDEGGAVVGRGREVAVLAALFAFDDWFAVEPRVEAVAFRGFEHEGRLRARARAAHLALVEDAQHDGLFTGGHLSRAG